MSRHAWLLAMSFVLPGAVAAQEPTPPAAKAAKEPRPLREVMSEPADITLSPGQKVGEVLRPLAERHRVAIEFAKPELADIPLGELKIEISFRGVPFQLALSYTLGRAGLAWEPRDDTVVVKEREDREGPAAERIRAALDQNTRLEFPNTPLRDAIQFLAHTHDVNVLIDEPAATEAGVNISDNIDVVLQGVKLAEALNILLEPAGLTYVMTNDVLLVTTPDRAAREIDTRSYDVSGLVGQNGYSNEAANVVTELLEPRSSLANAMIAAKGGSPVPLPQPRIVSYQQRLLVTASWADQRRVEEILKLMEPAARSDEGGARR